MPAGKPIAGPGLTMPAHLDSGWPHVRPPRLLFITGRPARDTTSGQLIMHRHLSVIQERFEVHRAHLGPPLANDTPYTELTLRPLYKKLCGSPRFARWAEGIDATLGVAVPHAQLHTLIERIRPDLILTVAEPPVFQAISSVAMARNLPLVTVVHDWAPVWIDMPGKLRPFADRRFARDCRNSTYTLNISEELARRFGRADRHRVLFPIPGGSPPSSGESAAAFHALYAGIFHYFHRAEMTGLCAELLRRGRPDLLRLIGMEPDWNARGMESVKAGAFYRGFLERAGLDDAFAAAGALLVICPFDKSMDAFSRYSFPSKLTEYSQHSRPLVLWAPPHAAAVRWAIRHNAALVVSDPDPRAAADALFRLEADDDLRKQLVASIKTASETFSPRVLNTQFEQTLWDALSNRTGIAY